MKVLLVAPQSHDTVLGMIGNHCRKALENIGYEIETFDFRQSRYFKSSFGSLLKKGIKKLSPFSPQRIPLIKSLEREKMNKSLLAVTREYRPHILLVLTGDNIFTETLEEIKKSGITTVNWFTDPVLDPGRKDFARNISAYYDYFFIFESERVLNYTKLKSRYIKTVPLACDPDVHKSIDLSEKEKQKYGSEVCFTGTIKFEREKILNSLTHFNLGIWSSNLKKSSSLIKFYRGKCLLDEENARIYSASDIVLDISTPYGKTNEVFYTNLRVFEVTACGAFLLTDKSPHLSKLYDIGEEIVCYRDEKELKELIKYYLSHPEERKRIAKKGQERAYHEHTYEKRLRKILSIVIEKMDVC